MKTILYRWLITCIYSAGMFILLVLCFRYFFLFLYQPGVDNLIFLLVFLFLYLVVLHGNEARKI